jgi:Asp-tRNA(Asn)/Glu-tRNA(Gln) amidotransferase A subunit family amidase
MLVVALVAAMSLQEQKPKEPEPPPPFGADEVRAAAKVVGLPLTDSELELMLPGVIDNLRAFERMRARPLDNSVPMALVFDPLAPLMRAPAAPEPAKKSAWTLPEGVRRPERLEDLAYADIPTLAALVRSRAVTCEELANMYLARLERLDAKLHCVVTLTRDRALEQARALDQELAGGHWRGPLHGIPYGAKDLLAARGAPTTWGAEPYQDQVLDLDAAVIERLDAAGAVLIAKLSLGALAWGDVSFGGRTRNPWKPDVGSSGSSAGSSAASEAGGVAFAIGSETWGSIVSPAERCGTSALRPTFGRVSRHGAMALSWSLDKLGPICRSAQDAAIVFGAIEGRDPRDPSTLNAPPARRAGEPIKRVGMLPEAAGKNARYAAFLEELKGMGLELAPVALPDYPVGDMMVLLSCEAACAFDELTRSGRDDLLGRQIAQAWPNVFRESQLIPAVEYVRANRLRTLLMRDMEGVFQGVDAFVAPSMEGDLLATTNLTGHPTVVVPYAFKENGTPTSVSFVGALGEDERLLALAARWQAGTDWHKRHPPE